MQRVRFVRRPESDKKQDAEIIHRDSSVN